MFADWMASAANDAGKPDMKDAMHGEYLQVCSEKNDTRAGGWKTRVTIVCICELYGMHIYSLYAFGCEIVVSRDNVVDFVIFMQSNMRHRRQLINQLYSTDRIDPQSILCYIILADDGVSLCQRVCLPPYIYCTVPRHRSRGRGRRARTRRRRCGPWPKWATRSRARWSRTSSAPWWWSACDFLFWFRGKGVGGGSWGRGDIFFFFKNIPGMYIGDFCIFLFFCFIYRNFDIFLKYFF